MVKIERSGSPAGWLACALGCVIVGVGGCDFPNTDIFGETQSGASATLHYVASADQIGPVVYRDPLGAVSPDSRWLAYTERDRVHVTPASGGAVTVIGPGTNSIRYLAWLPDSRRIAVRERVFDRSRQDWFVYDATTGERGLLWPGDSSGDVHPRAMDQLAWSPDGATVAGVMAGSGAAEICTADADGSGSRAVASGALSFPSWTPSGRLACLATREGRQTLQLPCGDSSASARYSGIEAYGRVAFSPNGADAYVGSPGEGGFLDLWAVSLADGGARRLTSFARDAYDPSVGPDGHVYFKTQDYRVFLATAPAEGGPPTALTTFQSETPSWSWDGAQVAFTYGDWRHVTDDIHYPDIAQHIGVVDATGATPWDAPTQVVRSSDSEDQAMNWSPNGQWIVFHTHQSGDDIWLMPADGSGEARMISQDGSETGWPRWSPDGRWIVFKSFRHDSAGARQAFVFVIGVDQETGETTPQRRVAWWIFPTTWALPCGGTAEICSSSRPRKPLAARASGAWIAMAVCLGGYTASAAIRSRRGSECLTTDAGRLRGPSVRRLLPDLPHSPLRRCSGATHARPVEQDPTHVFPRRRSDRVHGVQLPLPLLAHRSVGGC